MGGNIAIIKKFNNKIESVDGWTNSFSNVTKKLDFYTNPDNEGLKNEIEVFVKRNEILNGIVPSGYGIFIVDYDNKNIYTINGYSRYLDIMPVSISLEEKSFNNEKKFTSTYHDFFNNNLLAIETTVNKKIGKYDYEEISTEYKNISEVSDFKDLYDVIYWLEGDRYNSNPLKNNKGNEYIENGDIITHNNLWIDYKKLGWNYYNYPENYKGYFELFKQLLKDGICLNKQEIQEWDEFITNKWDDEEEIEYPNFGENALNYIRQQKLNKINNLDEK